MADTLSLEAQLASRLETETAKLRAAAARLPAPGFDGNRQLAALPEIAAGLDRRWISVICSTRSDRSLAKQGATSALVRNDRPKQKALRCIW